MTRDPAGELGITETDVQSRFVPAPARLAEPTPSMGWADEADPTMWKRIAIILGVSILGVFLIVGVGVLIVRAQS